jgi:hypothetical protein
MGIANGIQIVGLKGISPGVASTMMLADPVTAALLGILVLNETVTMNGLIGFGLVVVGLIMQCVSQNQPTEKAENKPTFERSLKEEMANVEGSERSTEKAPGSNLVLTQTKKKRNKNATELKSGIEINRMTSATVSRKESNEKIVASGDIRSAKDSEKVTKENVANRPSEKEPNEIDEEVNVQKQSNSQNEIADQISMESNHPKLEAGSVSQAISPQDGTEPKADSVVQPKLDSTSNLVTVPKDSVRKELTKRNLGFEFGLSGLSLQQQLAVKSAAQTGAEQVLQSPVSVRPDETAVGQARCSPRRPRLW